VLHALTTVTSVHMTVLRLPPNAPVTTVLQAMPTMLLMEPVENVLITVFPAQLMGQQSVTLAMPTSASTQIKFARHVQLNALNAQVQERVFATLAVVTASTLFTPIRHARLVLPTVTSVTPMVLESVTLESVLQSTPMLQQP
jgi:hypothetical protein